MTHANQNQTSGEIYVLKHQSLFRSVSYGTKPDQRSS